MLDVIGQWISRAEPVVIFINSVRTSQETRYVTATKPNRLMLFRETVAVYCENHREHRYTVWAESRVPSKGYDRDPGLQLVTLSFGPLIRMKVTVSNLVPETGCTNWIFRGILSSCRQISRQNLILGHDHFFSHPSKFIVLKLTCNFMLHRLR
jgi:hypothetical protein